MSNRIKSILLGAFIAALVTLPARAGDNDWTKIPPRNFDARSLKVDGLVGDLTVDVRGGGPMTLEISGPQWRVNKVSVNASHGELTIHDNNPGNVWDWKHWFDFSGLDEKNRKGNRLNVHVIVPHGAAVDVDGLVGNAVIGNTDGPLNFETSGDTHSQIGNVLDATISLAGSGKVTLGNVAGKLHAETAGSGDIRTGNTGETHAEIAGSGSVSTGNVTSGIHVEIAGSGDFTAAGVRGPTHVEIAGSGSVNIASGEANPLHVEIMGSGDVTFGGVAVNPKIESMGSGSVRLKAYRGNLSNEGNANLKIGN